MPHAARALSRKVNRNAAVDPGPAALGASTPPVRGSSFAARTAARGPGGLAALEAAPHWAMEGEIAAARAVVALAEVERAAPVLPSEAPRVVRDRAPPFAPSMRAAGAAPAGVESAAKRPREVRMTVVGAPSPTAPGDPTAAHRPVPPRLVALLLRASEERPRGWSTSQVVEQVVSRWHALRRAEQGLPPEQYRPARARANGEAVTPSPSRGVVIGPPEAGGGINR